MMQPIGLDRKYETMVFKVKSYCDADGCDCGQPLIDGQELDMAGYNTRSDAQKGHEHLCEVWASKPGRGRTMKIKVCCAWCGKLMIGNVEAVVVSHGICPKCAAEESRGNLRTALGKTPTYNALGNAQEAL